MMMGPGNFIYNSIEGKTRDEAMSAVRELWDEIRRLKKLMDEDPYCDEMMTHPMPGVRISVYMDYIKAARDYFDAHGWEYDLSPEEKASKEFDDRIDDIEKITVKYGGYLCGGETREITFNGDEVNVEKGVLLGYVSSESDLKYAGYEGLDSTSFLDELKEFHLGEWEKNYENLLVEDGVQWEVVIYYNDGKKRKFEGDNAFPYNFNDFLIFMGMDIFE